MKQSYPLRLTLIAAFLLSLSIVFFTACPTEPELETYSISYLPNGATAGTAPEEQTKVHGVALVLASNSGNLARSGYYFSGWNTVVDGTGTNYPEGASYAVNKSATLYANWSLIPSYSVSYNSNGSTAGSLPEPQLKTHGQPLTLASNTGGLQKIGWTFSGWNSLASGEGTDYPEGASYTAESAIILYAKWTREIYTIGYNGNNASTGSAPESQLKVQGVSITLATNYGNLTKTGFVFAGWNSLASGLGDYYPEGSSFSLNQSMTLYAHWSTCIAPATPQAASTANAYQYRLWWTASAGHEYQVERAPSGGSYSMIRDWSTISDYVQGSFYATSSPYQWRVRSHLIASPGVPSPWVGGPAITGGGGSCPFIYVGDGKGSYSYLTDLQGPIIGLPPGNLMRTRVPLYTYQNVVLEGQRRDKDGRYRLKMREIIPEISYMDEVKLMTVDLPIGYEIASSSAEQTYGNGYVNPFKLYTLKNPRTLKGATAWNGDDVTAELATVDGKPASVAGTDLPWYELDFGEFDAANAKLIVTPWVLFGPHLESKIYARASIELQDATGKWIKVKTLGFPAGDMKKMVVDLSGLFPSASRKIRLNIGTRTWVRWVVDGLALDDSAPVNFYQRLVPLESAKLINRGGGSSTTPTFELRGIAQDDVKPVPENEKGKGRFTKYGKVTELLEATDDMYVVWTNGDEIALTFKDPKPPIPGYERHLVLQVMHYFKSFYYEHQVEPLPFRGMSSYPYPETEKYPDTADHRRYLKKYQTRVLK